jgi:hypothetical protein
MHRRVGKRKPMLKNSAHEGVNAVQRFDLFLARRA